MQNGSLENTMEKSKEITLKQLQNTVNQWINTYGVRYFSELTNTAILMEEVGELARLMARTYGEQSFKNGEKDNSIADELADILWVVTCLANQMNIDLEEAVKKNLDKKTNRDKDRHLNNKKLG